MARLHGISLAAGALAFSVPAAAQYGQYGAPPPRMPEVQQRQQASSEPTPTAEVHRAAACLAGRDAAAIERLLGTARFSEQERRQATSLLRSAQRCVRSRDPIVTSAAMFRGAAAEALYRSRFQAAPAAPTPPAAVMAAALDVQADPAAASLGSAVTLAECSAAANPAAVRTLLLSEVGSAAEGEALRALNPVLSGCVSAGTTINANRSTLRALLAEALYRWSVVQRDGAGSAWAAPVAAAN